MTKNGKPGTGRRRTMVGSLGTGQGALASGISPTRRMVARTTSRNLSPSPSRRCSYQAAAAVISSAASRRSLAAKATKMPACVRDRVLQRDRFRTAGAEGLYAISDFCRPGHLHVAVLRCLETLDEPERKLGALFFRK